MGSLSHSQADTQVVVLRGAPQHPPLEGGGRRLGPRHPLYRPRSTRRANGGAEPPDFLRRPRGVNPPERAPASASSRRPGGAGGSGRERRRLGAGSAAAAAAAPGAFSVAPGRLLGKAAAGEGRRSALFQPGPRDGRTEPPAPGPSGALPGLGDCSPQGGLEALNPCAGERPVPRSTGEESSRCCPAGLRVGAGARSAAPCLRAQSPLRRPWGKGGRKAPGSLWV